MCPRNVNRNEVVVFLTSNGAALTLGFDGGVSILLELFQRVGRVVAWQVAWTERRFRDSKDRKPMRMNIFLCSDLTLAIPHQILFCSCTFAHSRALRIWMVVYLVIML